jgi:hypothetical protein
MGHSAGSGLNFGGEIPYLLLDPGVDGNKDRMAAGVPPTAML